LTRRVAGFQRPAPAGLAFGRCLEQFLGAGDRLEVAKRRHPDSEGGSRQLAYGSMAQPVAFLQRREPRVPSDPRAPVKSQLTHSIL